MPTPKPSRLSTLSDAPAVKDALNFTPYAKTLADIVADPATETPLTIGVFGDWASGKTSLIAWSSVSCGTGFTTVTKRIHALDIESAAP